MNTVASEPMCPKSTPIRLGTSLSLLPPLLVVGMLVLGLATHSVHSNISDRSRLSSIGDTCQAPSDNGGFVIPTSSEEHRVLVHIYATEMLYTYRVAQSNRARRASVSPGQRSALDVSYNANAASYNALANIYPEIVAGKKPLPRQLPCSASDDDGDVSAQ